MRSGRQTRKRQREQDSSPVKGNSKRQCVNKDSSTSGREGMSNTDNTHSGKYCVTFFSKISNLHMEKTKTKQKNLGGGVRLEGAYHTTLAFH